MGFRFMFGSIRKIVFYLKSDYYLSKNLFLFKSREAFI